VVDLAALLSLTPATVSDALAALERKGLLVRKKNPEDRRRFLLTLTTRGQQIVKALEDFAEPLRGALEEVEDKEGFFLGLLTLLSGLVRRGVVVETGMCLTCRHLRRERGFYCALLQAPLSTLELRLACPDHAPA